jgi:hypothetical protein
MATPCASSTEDASFAFPAGIAPLAEVLDRRFSAPGQLSVEWPMSSRGQVASKSASSVSI